MCAVNIGQTGIGPTSLDLLTQSGVLPYDASMYVTGTPSPYLERQKGASQYPPYSPQLAPSLPRDTYSPPKNNGGAGIFSYLKAKYKDIAFGLLTLYIAGVIASKGSKNPIEGAKGLGRVCNKLLSGFCWLVKKISL